MYSSAPALLILTSDASVQRVCEASIYFQPAGAGHGASLARLHVKAPLHETPPPLHLPFFYFIETILGFVSSPSHHNMSASGSVTHKKDRSARRQQPRLLGQSMSIQLCNMSVMEAGACRWEALPVAMIFPPRCMTFPETTTADLQKAAPVWSCTDSTVADSHGRYITRSLRPKHFIVSHFCPSARVPSTLVTVNPSTIIVSYR